MKNYENINRRTNVEKIDYENIHCDDTEKVINVVRCILSIWDLERGKNEIRTEVI